MAYEKMCFYFLAFDIKKAADLMGTFCGIHPQNLKQNVSKTQYPGDDKNAHRS